MLHVYLILRLSKDDCVRRLLRPYGLADFELTSRRIRYTQMLRLKKMEGRGGPLSSFNELSSCGYVNDHSWIHEALRRMLATRGGNVA